MPVHPTSLGGRRRRGSAVLLALVVSASLALGACSSGGSGGSDRSATSGTSTSAPATASDYSGPGPYPVGTVELSTGGADPKTVYVYYPADPARLDEGTPVTGYSSAVAFPEAFRSLVPPAMIQDIALDATADAPIADGPFPIVLYSHGFGSYPQYSAGHLAHLASWGFVAAAPDHTTRDLAAVASGTVTPGDDDVVDLRATLKVLRVEGSGGGRFAGALDDDAVAVEGHSAGGAAGALLASSADDGVDAFIGLAPASPLEAITDETPPDALAAAYAQVDPPAVPSMLITGERDGVIPLAAVDAEYEWLAPPKRYAVLADAGHNAFTDLCAPIRAQGGLSQLAEQMPAVAPLLSLGEDGCTDGYLDPDTGYAVTNHLVVAQLRWVFGIDPTEASLAPAYVDSLFPGAVARLDADPPVDGQG